MFSLLSWLFGLSSFPSGEVESAELDFLYVPEGYAGLLFLFLLAAAAGFAFWCYLRRKELLGRRRWFFMGLRVAALLMIFFMLAGPMLKMVARNTQQSTVIFLADNSKSMDIVDKRVSAESVQRSARALGLVDAPEDDSDKPVHLNPGEKARATGAKRMDLARAVLGNDDRGLLSEFDQFSVKTYSFGEGSAKPGPTDDRAMEYGQWVETLEGADPETRLGDALASAMDDNRGRPIAGIVVVSDGSSNGGQDPSESLQRAGRRGIPVYFVGIGEPDAKDFQISFVEMRDVLFLEDPAPVTVKLRHWGYAGREVTLEVVDDEDEVIASRVVTLGESGEQTETVKIIPRKPGKATYTVRAEAFGDELAEENNSKSKDVRVIDSRIKVLWIETYPRWEFRYAKNLVKRDSKRFEPRILLFESDPQIRGQDRLYIESFPQNEKEMFQYHVVVLGDIEAGRLSQEEQKLLKRFVSEEGGAVVFLPGNRFGPEEWLGTELEELVPVVVKKGAVRHDVAAEIADPVTVPLRARRTEIGRRHPLLFVSDDQRASQEAWERFLLIYRTIGIERAKPGAQVLLETAEDKEQAEPLVVYSRYGSGTITYMGTDEFWRWRYRPGPIIHDRYWGSVLQQVALARLLGESRRLTLYLSEKEISVGGKQIITARVLGEDFRPIEDASINVTIARQDEDTGGEQIELTLNAVKGQMGMFEGTWRPSDTGRHEVTLDHEGEQVSVGFRVVPPQLEFENPALDKARLASWAKLTGGNVYDPWDLEELPHEAKAKARAAVVRTEDELWDAPFWAFLFIVLAGTEWYMRKRDNLA